MSTTIESWINKSDVDYYTMFIKAWIPFNAWYMKNYYDDDPTIKRTSDKSIITYLQENDNDYKSKILNLLRVQSVQGSMFRSLISDLYTELQSHSIPDEENKISFENTCLASNVQSNHTFSKGNKTYYAEYNINLPKTQKRLKIQVLKKNNQQVLHLIELFKWSKEDLNSNTDFCTISDINVAKNIRLCFDEINPRKPVKIVLPPKISRGGDKKQPNHSIIIDQKKHLYFIDDLDKVSKVIIQILYELRCKIFHGEIEPKEAFLGAFKSAYEIQKTLITELN